MCHQKGDFFVRKKVLSLLLAFCMIVAPFTVVQVAAAEPTKVQDSGKLQTALESGGLIQLESDISTKDQSDDFGRLVVTASNVVLDLNGHQLTTEQIEIKPGASLTIQDSSDTKTGIVLGTGNSHLILVWPAQNSTSAASFTLESGTVQTPDSTKSNIHTIYSSGTVEINGGSVIAEGSVSAAIYVNGYNEKFIDPLETNPNTFIPVANQVSCTLSGDASIQSKVYGVCLFGEGPDSNGAYDYDKVKLYILDNASIEVSGTDPDNVDGGGQGIATNSSGDKYAGFTIKMSGGSIDAGTHGCGMYLPAIGKTTVTGGSVYGGNQGIRIAAGELTVSDDALIQNNEARKTSDDDLVNGGSGGTAGAIVAGKASSAYKGGLQINIEGGTIENKATGNADAIVVSDKNMAHNNFENQSLAVTVTGGEIMGNVYCISNLDTSSTTQDGGKSSITLKGENVRVTGNVENASHSPLLIAEGATVNGNAEKIGNDEGCAVVIDKATVSGDTSTATKLDTVEDDKILSTNGKTYTDLATALRELPADGTLYLGKGTFAADAMEQLLIRSAQSGVTIRGQGDDTVIDTGSYSVYGQAGFFVGADNVTIENLKIVSTSKDPNVAAIKFSYGNTPYRVLNGGTLRNVTLSSDLGHGVNVHGVDGMLIDGVIVEKAGKLSISVANSPEVTVQNTTTATGGWGSDIGIMYTEGGEAYKNVSHVILGDGNKLSNGGVFYSEYTGDTIGSSQEQFSFEGDDNMVYRFPDKNEKSQYVYTTTVPRAALLREGQDPLYYGELNEKNLINALADAQNGDTIVVDGNPLAGSHTITVDKAVTIRGTDNSAIIGDLIIAADGVKIEHTNLSEAAVQVTDGISTADLSYNYWGGEPVELDGVEVYPYYDSPEMGQDDLVEEPGNKPSGGGSSSDDSSVGSPLPTVPTEPGEPTDPTDPSTPSGFVSDTTNDLTVNGTYQFRITSLDGTIPFLTVDNANFRVEFASQEGNDFFFKIHAQGAAGSTTVVSVNGVRLLTATVGGSAAGVISDTTAPFTVKKGETYQFRLTASARPSFAAGSASFTVEYAGQIGSDYFYKVYAAGNAGDGCGFYINGEASPVAIATIA